VSVLLAARGVEESLPGIPLALRTPTVVRATSEHFQADLRTTVGAPQLANKMGALGSCGRKNLYNKRFDAFQRALGMEFLLRGLIYNHGL